MVSASWLRMLIYVVSDSIFYSELQLIPVISMFRLLCQDLILTISALNFLFPSGILQFSTVALYIFSSAEFSEV